MIRINANCLLVLFFVALLCGVAQAQGPEIVAKYTVVMTSPPNLVPSGRVVDGPILGNGDLGIAIAGPPEEQRFYFGKNDFWSQQASPLSVGGLILRVPGMAGATYRQEQDLASAEVRGFFTKGSLIVNMRTWAAATENLAVTELSLQGGAGLPATAELFPAPTALKDNEKPVNLGREQHGNGRWYFDGLIDEVQVFDRALAQTEIQTLVNMQRVPQGLVRRWAFDTEEGKTPVDTVAKLVLGPACAGLPEIFRPVERPIDEPTRCRPDGYHLDYQRYGLGKSGRAVKLMHEWNYIDAGQAPPLTQVTVAAWIYIFKAGDANFILSKGGWNEAYALALDRGRLRFNIGERFTRTSAALPTQQWVHVAGTFDGSVLRAYVDGQEVLPRARYIHGGATGDVIWITRNADGPLDEQYAWPTPLPPTRTPATRGREVTFATRLAGTNGTASNGAIRFDLKPGAKVYLVMPVVSDLDNPDHVAAARARASALTPAELDKLNAAHRGWWKKFWSESFVEIGDPLLEKFYYASHYIMASASRTGKVAPGLYGNWVTTDHPSWNGDYTLNYNLQTPYLGLYSSNHVATADSYDTPVLDFMNRAKIYARTMLGIRGVYYPGHIGPWGLERPFDYDPFMGQKSDAAFLAVPMLIRFYSTYDPHYAEKVYPFVLEVGNFWEDYLKFENGRYNIYDDCTGEVGPWNQTPSWATCGGVTTNPTNEIGHLRAVFKGLIDMSQELSVDADGRAKWQEILDHLPDFPVDRGRLGQVVWPSGQIGLVSKPELLEAARKSLAQYSNHPLFAPALARIGNDPEALLANLRKHVQENGYPNAYIFFQGGGVETASTIPGAIDEMLLQSYEGVLRLFPNWPKDKEARFGNLRAYGAFLVSSELAKGQVGNLAIHSEKGRECTLQNPWAGKALRLYRNGKKGERLVGDKVTFKTSAGERISVSPE